MNHYLKEYIDKGMVLVLDYDGVMFEARWYKTRINMRNETEEKLYAAHKRGENLVTDPIHLVQEVVAGARQDVLVLSHIHDKIEYDFKVTQIQRYYPSISKENVLWAKSPEDKIRFLEEIKAKYGPFIYIDDAHSTLIKFENHFDDDCAFFHVSSLYV